MYNLKTWTPDNCPNLLIICNTYSETMSLIDFFKRTTTLKISGYIDVLRRCIRIANNATIRARDLKTGVNILSMSVQDTDLSYYENFPKISRTEFIQNIVISTENLNEGVFWTDGKFWNETIREFPCTSGADCTGEMVHTDTYAAGTVNMTMQYTCNECGYSESFP